MSLNFFFFCAIRHGGATRLVTGNFQLVSYSPPFRKTSLARRMLFQWQWRIFRPPHGHRWHYKASGPLPGRIIQTCVCTAAPLLPFLLFVFFLSKGSIRAASRMARYSGVTADLFSGRLLLLGGWRAHKSRGLILLNRSLKRRAVITVHASAELKRPPNPPPTPSILSVNSSYWRRRLLSRSKWGFYF